MKNNESGYGEVVRSVRARIEEGRERLRHDHTQIEKRLSLGLDFEHYNIKDESDAPSRILPRDPGIFDLVRYNACLTLKRFPVSVRCSVEDESAGDFSDEAADETREALEEWLDNPRNRFSDTRRRYVWGGYSAGLWCARLDYDPDRKTAVIRPQDPRNVILPDGIFDPHDPDCERVIIIEQVPTERVRRMRKWKGASKARPDPGYGFPSDRDTKRLLPGQVDLSGDSTEKGYTGVGSRTTVAYMYERNAVKTRARVTGGDRVPPGAERVLCGDCGWASPPQREMLTKLPNEMPCPQCGGLAEKTYEPISQELAYPDGRLVICAPLDPGMKDPFYDSDWPVEWPTYPLLWWSPIVYPHRLLPQSDVSAHKTGVLASNALIRLTYEQALASKPRFKMPPVGTYVNSRGMPYLFKPEDGDILWQAQSGGPPMPIELMQGQPLNTSLFALYDRLQSRFATTKGSSQISVDPKQSLDIPVGTVQQMTETGNVPLDAAGEGLYDAESPLMDCLAATLKFAYVPARRLPRRNATGRTVFKTFNGLKMPKVKVTITAGPQLNSNDMAKLKAYQFLSSLPPNQLRGAARFARIDQEVVKQIEEDRAAAPPPGQPGQPGAPGQPPRPPGMDPGMQPPPGMPGPGAAPPAAMTGAPNG